MRDKEKYDLLYAHGFSINHKNELEKDKVWGCFYCGRIFNTSEIEEWITDKNGTAICPYCHIDAVIGESSGFPITEGFLNQMKKKWFDR